MGKLVKYINIESQYIEENADTFCKQELCVIFIILHVRILYLLAEVLLLILLLPAVTVP